MVWLSSDPRTPGTQGGQNEQKAGVPLTPTLTATLTQVTHLRCQVCVCLFENLVISLQTPADKHICRNSSSSRDGLLGGKRVGLGSLGRIGSRSGRHRLNVVGSHHHQRTISPPTPPPPSTYFCTSTLSYHGLSVTQSREANPLSDVFITLSHPRNLPV